MEKNYTFKTKHLFKILRIVNKTNIANSFKDLWMNIDSGDKKEDIEKAQEAIGIELGILLIESLEEVEHELYDLLADLEGKTPEEIENQDVDETIDAIMSIAKSDTVKSFLDKVKA